MDVCLPFQGGLELYDGRSIPGTAIDPCAILDHLSPLVVQKMISDSRVRFDRPPHFVKSGSCDAEKVAMKYYTVNKDITCQTARPAHLITRKFRSWRSLKDLHTKAVIT
jgi:hypothetical protein